MKKTALSLAIATSVFLSGCDNNPHGSLSETDLINNEVDSMAGRQAISEFNSEKKEIDQFLKTVQEKDPSIKSAYYGPSPDGSEEKVLYIQKEEDEQIQTSSFPGFFAGYALASMMNNNSGFYHSNAATTTNMTAKQAKRHKNGMRAQYIRGIKTAKVNSIRSNPSRMSSISRGVMSRVSSARSAGYSSGS